MTLRAPKERGVLFSFWHMLLSHPPPYSLMPWPLLLTLPSLLLYGNSSYLLLFPLHLVAIENLPQIPHISGFLANHNLFLSTSPFSFTSFRFRRNRRYIWSIIYLYPFFSLSLELPFTELVFNILLYISLVNFYKIKIS